LIQETGVQHNFNFETGRQESFKVNDYLSATPDAYEEGIWTGDAKCQYSIQAFIEQNDKLKTAYYYQLQTQMMALKVEQAFLINYLTKPEEFGQDDWEEYPFPIEDRYYIHEVKKDEKICDDILIAAEKNFPLLIECSDLLLGATDLHEHTFFNWQMKDKVRFAKLKDTNWLNFDKEVFRFNNEFYYIKK
jgi:hypothetical protein